MKRPAGRPTAPAPEARPLWHDDAPIRVGVSTCLLGREVRFDGGHKRDRFLTDVLGSFVEWVPVCPEVEIGLGIPRESIRLVRDRDGVRLVAERSARDHTRAMQEWAHRRVRELAALDLCGYVLKKDSPSCGMERVRVYPAGGGPARRDGRGVFAEALIAHLESLPVEEEGRLHDPRLRENFVERVFAYRRLRSLFAERFTVGRLVEFHTMHKLQLLAHSPADYRTLGRLVAEARSLPRGELRARYEAGFMRALARQATPSRQTNVLHHVLGHFRKRLDGHARAEVLALIEDYRAGLIPLVVPLTLVRHHVRACGLDYLARQVYLDPHPKELMLRNHV